MANTSYTKIGGSIAWLMMSVGTRLNCVR